MLTKQYCLATLAVLALADLPQSASAQSAGPLMPHVGGQVTTSFSNAHGPDSESTLIFKTVNSEVLSVDYSSTRGLLVKRNIRVIDRQTSRTYVLGYGASMPLVIPNTTSLGISGASLVELRTTGRTPLSLVYSAGLDKIDGELTLIEKDIKLPLLVEDQVAQVPALHAAGRFGSGAHTATGDFYFLDNKANPMMLQDSIRFSWENEPRAERITRVAAGVAMRSAMEQALNTMRHYDLYGIHFDFDKATVRPETASLVADIALTLKNNPRWRLQINGHTDSLGDAAYNQRLSADRAAEVKTQIVRRGIAPDRLQTAGLGETQPKGDNNTLQGRSLNRRVELVRIDK